MSISSISSNSSSYQLQALQAQRAKEMKAIEDAVASGNISAAQSALKTLQSNATATQTPSGTNAIGTARMNMSALDGQNALRNSSTGQSSAQTRGDQMANLFSAIESGDLASAQSALSTLKSSGPPPPPPMGAMNSGGENDETAQALNDMFEAVKSGDSSKAQAALTALEASDGFSASGVDSSTDVGKDLESIIAAVKSGDMSKARASLQELGDDLQSSYPPPPPRMGGFSDSSFSGTSSNQDNSDVTSIFDAIESGDLTSAKALLEAFKEKLASVESDSESSGRMRPLPFPSEYADSVSS